MTKTACAYNMEAKITSTSIEVIELKCYSVLPPRGLIKTIKEKNHCTSHFTQVHLHGLCCALHVLLEGKKKSFSSSVDSLLVKRVLLGSLSERQTLYCRDFDSDKMLVNI